MIIEESWVHDAIEYLMGNSRAGAAAKGMVVRTDHQRKKIRAQLIRDCELTTVAMLEAYADAHELYEAACERHARAVEENEFHENERNKCATILDTWRTQQATSRLLGKVA